MTFPTYASQSWTYLLYQVQGVPNKRTVRVILSVQGVPNKRTVRVILSVQGVPNKRTVRRDFKCTRGSQ